MKVRAAVLLCLGISACVFCWLVLAPAALGGGTSYLVTHGDSMEPRFRAGDLAALHPAEVYRVGDVVGYRSQLMNTVVMHRIVDVADGHYVLRGDNNDFVDPDHPTRDQILGRLLLRIPQGGIWLDRLTSPAALGLLVFGLLVTGGTAARSSPRRRRRTVSQHAARPHRARRSMAGLPHWATTTAVTAGIVGVLGVGLGAMAWTTPTTAPAAGAVDSGLEPSMTFSYTAEVPRSPAYDDTTVTSPEPIFRRLTDEVEVRYTYRGEPGSVSVVAELSAASGWHSAVPLATETEFAGHRHTGRVSLDLEALDRRAQAAAEATGIPAGQVEVVVVPTVTTAEGEPFSQSLAFTLTPLQLTLAGDPAALDAGASPDSKAAAAADAQTATLGIAGRELPVTTARTLALILLAGALLAATLIAVFARLSAPATEAGAIHRRYGHLLLRVQPMPAPAGRPVIDVVDFPTLAKLAERYELLVLHWRRSDVETFVVQDQGTTYRYRTGVGVVRGSAERIPEVV